MKKHILMPLRWEGWERFCRFHGQQRKQRVLNKAEVKRDLLVTVNARKLIQSNISMHHYGCVALYEASILQKDRFWAASLASSSSISNDVRSPLMFLSQVERGRPGGLLKSSGWGSNSIRFASASPSTWAICPNNKGRLLLTMEKSGGCSVMWRTS